MMGNLRVYNLPPVHHDLDALCVAAATSIPLRTWFDGGRSNLTAVALMSMR